MVNVKNFVNTLLKQKVEYFSGVPDSTLDQFINYLTKLKKIKHRVAVNEGGAVALAAGYYLAKKKNSLSLFTKFRFGKCFKSTYITS